MKLLLAEDERELSDALTVILTHSNYLVDAVYTGTDALDYLQVEHYDGVILDVMMPGMDGFEVCRKVREKSQVPIIMLTAREDEVDKVLGLELGADERSALARLNVLEINDRPDAALPLNGNALTEIACSNHVESLHICI